MIDEEQLAISKWQLALSLWLLALTRAASWKEK
jgi:hypothetical protein